MLFRHGIKDVSALEFFGSVTWPLDQLRGEAFGLGARFSVHKRPIDKNEVPELVMPHSNR